MQSIIYFVCVLLIHDHKVLFIYKLENPKHIDNRKTKYNRDKDKLIDKSKLDISKYIVITCKTLSHGTYRENIHICP